MDTVKLKNGTARGTVVVITAPGDPDVGLPDWHTEIDLVLELLEDEPEQRALLRAHLRDTFTELWGEPVSVQFDDELRAAAKAEDMAMESAKEPTL